MKLKDKKIRILSYESYVNDNGFSVEEWKPIHEGKLWAYYRQLSGKEFFAATTVNATEDVVFTVNHRVDIDTDMLLRTHQSCRTPLIFYHSVLHGSQLF